MVPRSRILTYFGLLATAIVVLLCASGIWIGTQVSEPALSSILTALVLTGISLLGLVGWIAIQVDDNLTRPISELTIELADIAQGEGKLSYNSTHAHLIRPLGEAAEGVVNALEAARKQSNMPNYNGAAPIQSAVETRKNG